MIVSLDRDKFSSFIRILSVFKDLCQDVDIRDGFIRQNTDNKLSLFEIDLTYLIGETSIPITKLKEKFDLIKCFYGQELVTIESEDSYYKISDEHSSLKFKKPELSYLDNRFITDSEKPRNLSVSEEQLLLNVSLSKIISDRIKVVSQGFSVNELYVNFNNEVASITSIKTSKDQSAIYLNNIMTEQVINCSTCLNTIPFIVDHDNEILLKIYDISDSKALSKFLTTIGDTNITIYCRSYLVKDSEESNEE